jgi:hypothetical protein
MSCAEISDRRKAMTLLTLAKYGIGRYGPLCHCKRH